MSGQLMTTVDVVLGSVSPSTHSSRPRTGGMTVGPTGRNSEKNDGPRTACQSVHALHPLTVVATSANSTINEIRGMEPPVVGGMVSRCRSAATIGVGETPRLVQEPGRSQPGGIGVVREEQAVPLDGVDQLPRDLRTDGGAAQAASEIAVRLRGGGVHVRRAVNHDRAIARVIVDAGLETVEPERVAVVADVGFSRAEEPEARHVALGLVRERRRHGLAAATAVRDELLKQE